jgi:hypothetical protein
MVRPFIRISRHPSFRRITGHGCYIQMGVHGSNAARWSQINPACWAAPFAEKTQWAPGLASRVHLSAKFAAFSFATIVWTMAIIAYVPAATQCDQKRRSTLTNDVLAPICEDIVICGRFNR